MDEWSERNHAVVDRCLAKIMYENPGIDPEIAQVWVVTAKNSYSMCRAGLYKMVSVMSIGF